MSDLNKNKRVNNKDMDNAKNFTQVMYPLQVHSIHGQGKRANQEDSLFPLISNHNIKNNLYIVCDGIGGAEKGEIASKMTVESVSHYFQENKKENVDATFIQKVIEYVQEQISQYLQQNPEAEGMGTTLTLLYFSENNHAIAAHIGDSRIYHIRNSSILWQTKDHSWINEMLDRNLLTPEQAADHPRKNVITRALQGNIDKAVKADVHTIKNIVSGDSFFLCSDGILESISDQKLSEIVGSGSSIASKTQTIEQICSEHSQDNYSAFLIEVMPCQQSDKSGQTIEAKAVGKWDIICDGVKNILNIFKKKKN